MEPIERELALRKAKLRALAIELQRLEDRRARSRPRYDPDGDDEIEDHRRKTNDVRWAVRELEEIVAEGRNPPRMPKPKRATRLTAGGRRRLSQEERQAIAAETRASLPPELQGREVEIRVEPLTTKEGSPQVHIWVA